jgi:hypothetical protein
LVFPIPEVPDLAIKVAIEPEVAIMFLAYSGDHFSDDRLSRQCK